MAEIVKLKSKAKLGVSQTSVGHIMYERHTLMEICIVLWKHVGVRDIRGCDATKVGGAVQKRCPEP